MNGKVFPEVLPDSPAPDPVGPPTPSTWCSPVKVQPQQVQDSKEPEVAQDQDHKESTAKLCIKELMELTQDLRVPAVFGVKRFVFNYTSTRTASSRPRRFAHGVRDRDRQ